MDMSRQSSDNFIIRSNQSNTMLSLWHPMRSQLESVLHNPSAKPAFDLVARKSKMNPFLI